MALGHIDQVAKKVVENSEVKGASMQVVISPNEGWENHVMRVFEIEVGGHTPRHAHPWPHINYILEGEGSLFLNGIENPIKAGSYAYVPSSELHQFQNTGSTTLKFICIVPIEGHY